MTRRELVAFLPAVSLPRCTSLQSSSTPAVTAPDFSLKNADGATVRLSDYKGKVVLLNFWATWCGGCKKEIPWFIEFQNAYKDRGFAVLGASLPGCAPPEPASASPAGKPSTMTGVLQPSSFQRMGKPCLAGCLTSGVHRDGTHGSP